MKRVRTPLTRSQVMSRIRGVDTKPEMLLRRALWATHVRFRVQWRHPIAGRIDISMPGKKVAVQVDGCFWHGCPTHGVKPKTNSEFWNRKLQTNIDRDRRQTETLEREGWKVLRIWEHQLEDPSGVADAVARVILAINASVKVTR